MKDADEALATERLLNLIRKTGPRARDSKAEVAASGSPSSAAGGALFNSERVALTRPLRPRALRANRVRIGLDIGHRAVKMVRMERGARGFRLLQLGIAEVVPGDNATEALMEAQVEAAGELLKDVPAHKVRIVTALSDPGVIIRQATLPRMSSADLEKTIPFEARKHIPYNPSQVALRYQVVSGGRKDPTYQVLLVAVPHQALERHRALMERLGIEVYAIEVEPLALANAYLLTARSSQETIVILDMGASRTLIDIQRQGGMFFCRHLPISVGRFYREAQARLRLTEEAGEAKQRGEEVREEDLDLDGQRDALRPVIESLLMEIRRSLAYYDNVTGRMGFSRMLLTGGGALLPGIRTTLERDLELPVGLMDPLEGVSWDDRHFGRAWVERTRPLWATAIGLATRA